MMLYHSNRKITNTVQVPENAKSGYPDHNKLNGATKGAPQLSIACTRAQSQPCPLGHLTVTGSLSQQWPHSSPTKLLFVFQRLLSIPWKLFINTLQSRNWGSCWSQLQELILHLELGIPSLYPSTTDIWGQATLCVIGYWAMSWLSCLLDTCGWGKALLIPYPWIGLIYLP